LDAEWLERWRPSESWADFVEPAVRTLWTDPSDVRAWARVAMVLGDAHAPALCFVVARHGMNLAGAGDPARGRLSGHAALAALDLGFAKYEDGRTTIDHDAEHEWLDATFGEIGGLETSALFALCVIASKLGLVEGPVGPSMEDYGDLKRWTLRNEKLE
jgi:hypothetical protein